MVRFDLSLMVEQTKMHPNDSSEMLTFHAGESDEKDKIADTLNKEERERVHNLIQTYAHMVRYML